MGSVLSLLSSSSVVVDPLLLLPKEVIDDSISDDAAHCSIKFSYGRITSKKSSTVKVGIGKSCDIVLWLDFSTQGIVLRRRRHRGEQEDVTVAVCKRFSGVFNIYQLQQFYDGQESDCVDGNYVDGNYNKLYLYGSVYPDNNTFVYSINHKKK